MAGANSRAGIRATAARGLLVSNEDKQQQQEARALLPPLVLAQAAGEAGTLLLAGGGDNSADGGHAAVQICHGNADCGGIASQDSGHNASSHGDLAHSAHGHGGHSGHGHSYYTILFVVVAGVLGVIMQSLLTIPVLSGIPYTPAMLLVGMIIAVLDRYVPPIHNSEQFHYAVNAWEKIDGHLLLYVFLPPLIFSDALALRCESCRAGSP
eukprot:4127495-Prymnesium_polylepis.2